MNQTRSGETVLALYPTSRGVGFILMRGPLSPVDWGTRDARGKQKNARALEKVMALIEAHQPDAIVLEDPTAPGSSRSTRIKRLSRAIAALADSRAVEVHAYPRSRVKDCFEKYGARTRHEIAMVIAKQVAALERFLPRRRRLWEVEDFRMSIFNAAALAITFYAVAEK
jgi:hypothetical protein